MGFFIFTAALSLCFSVSFATYGPGYGPKNGDGPGHGPRNGDGPGHGPQFEAPKIKFEEPRIHLDSPKIVLDRPRINLQGGGHGEILEGPLHEGPFYFQNGKSLLYGKAFHGIPSSLSSVSSPLIYDSGYSTGKVDSGYSTGKVLEISAPIQVINHAPIVHERPILIRRPVVVSKGLTSTQDHLEKLHYAHSGLTLGGLGHSALIGHSVGAYSLPLAKGLHEGTLVYGGGHSLGGGHSHGAYNEPLILEQPKAFYAPADIGYASGKILGGPVLHGSVYHGDSFHGGASLKKY